MRRKQAVDLWRLNRDKLCKLSVKQTLPPDSSSGQLRNRWGRYCIYAYPSESINRLNRSIEMTRKPLDDFESREYSRSQIELELLDAVAIAEVPYPWNPADPETEAYLQAAEAQLPFADAFDEILETTSPPAIANLERLWSDTAAEDTLLETVQTALQQKFGAWVPHTWLEAIATQARSQQTASRSFAEQLVQCVNPLLPQWPSQDLQVLARPFAYAMRGESLDSSLAALSQKAWTELSEIEKARVSLAIARYALSQLPN